MQLARNDLVSKAWRYLPSERRGMVGLAILALIAAQAESAGLVLIALTAGSIAAGEEVVDLSVGPVSLDVGMQTAATVTLISIILAGGLGFVYGRLSAIRSADLERVGRDSIVSSFAAANWEYQSQQKSSRLQSRMLRLMDARSYAFLGLVRWGRALATIVVFVTVAAVMSFLAAVAIVVFGGLLSLAVFPIRRAVTRHAMKTATTEVIVSADFAEAIDHGADVPVLGAWPAFITRYSDKSLALQASRTRLAIAQALMPVVYQYGALALILLVLVLARESGSTGQFGQFAASALLILRSVQYGQQLQAALQALADAIPRIELLDAELVVPRPRVMPGNVELTTVDDIELSKVSYSYPDSVIPALDGVSLKLVPGSIVGIAGPSGSGKSTLAQILLRLRWPSSGDYVLNGRPARDFATDSWIHLVSHVPQNPRLLHGTLYENVTFYHPEISKDKVAASLRMVGLGDLIEVLPQGLETELGPSERALSGGQVQRLGIARALARDPQLVILDEPTSALDVDAEKVVADALTTLRRPDVIIAVIAHRPSTLALCDRIIVLDDGKIVADGDAVTIASQSEFLTRIWGSAKGPESR